MDVWVYFTCNIPRSDESEICPEKSNPITVSWQFGCVSFRYPINRAEYSAINACSQRGSLCPRNRAMTRYT